MVGVAVFGSSSFKAVPLVSPVPKGGFLSLDCSFSGRSEGPVEANKQDFLHVFSWFNVGGKVSWWFLQALSQRNDPNKKRPKMLHHLGVLRLKQNRSAGLGTVGTSWVSGSSVTGLWQARADLSAEEQKVIAVPEAPWARRVVLGGAPEKSWKVRKSTGVL